MNNLNDEVISLLEPEEVEKDVLESMEFSDPTHELLAEIGEKLQSLSVSSTGSEPLNPLQVQLKVFHQGVAYPNLNCPCLKVILYHGKDFGTNLALLSTKTRILLISIVSTI